MPSTRNDKEEILATYEAGLAKARTPSSSATRGSPSRR